MDKVIFVTLMMADKMEKRHFPVENDSLTEYSGETYYAINSVLSNSIEKGDNIKVVLLETNAGAQAGKKNAQLFIDELNSFNTAGANISYEIITSELFNDKARQGIIKKLVAILQKVQNFMLILLSESRHFQF